jgi:c-di-GMP-related signal transduction protein
MCQTVAELHRLDDTEAAFTAGLFSGLDVLLGEPMDRVLDGLALAPALRDALAYGRGPLGELVHTAIEYETEQVEVLARHASLAEWQGAFLKALEWTALVRDEMLPETTDSQAD